MFKNVYRSVENDFVPIFFLFPLKFIKNLTVISKPYPEMPQCHVWSCSMQIVDSITDHIATLKKKLKNHSDQPKSQMEKVAQGFGPQNKVNKPGFSANHLEKETF